MELTKHGLAKLSTADISALNECRLNDVASEYPDACGWVTRLGMMSIFNEHIPPEHRPLALYFVRRTEMALVEYSAMHREVVGHVSNPFRWSSYYRALHHGEVALSLMYQALDIISKSAAIRLFDKLDGTELQRLNGVYNTSKHRTPVPDESIWLVNAGFKTADHELKFEEFEEILRSAGRIATGLLQAIPTEPE